MQVSSKVKCCPPHRMSDQRMEIIFPRVSVCSITDNINNFKQCHRPIKTLTDKAPYYPPLISLIIFVLSSFVISNLRATFIVCFPFSCQSEQKSDRPGLFLPHSFQLVASLPSPQLSLNSILVCV